MPYNTPIEIHEEFIKFIDKHNLISGHHWRERCEITGWSGARGGWTRTYHKTLRGAEKEVKLREEIVLTKEAQNDI